MTHLFDIPYLITTYGYYGIFIIVFLESGLIFFLPGDSLLFTAGIFAAAFGLHLYVLIPLIFVATFLGGMMGYEVGVHLEKLRKYSFFRKMLKEEHINKAHSFFHKHGRTAIIFSRFIPIVRTFLPIVAGISKVEYKFFIKYSLISSFIWSAGVTLVGYFLGNAFPQIKDYMFVVVILIIVVSSIPVVLEIIDKSKKEKP